MLRLLWADLKNNFIYNYVEKCLDRKRILNTLSQCLKLEEQLNYTTTESGSVFLNFYYIYYIVCMGVRLIVFQKDQTDQARFISNSSSQNLTYNFYINLACLSWWVFGCLFVCFYVSNNFKTAEPIGPKFCVRHHVITGKVYGWSNFQKFASIKIRFLKILKIHEIFFWKSAKFFVFIIC